MSYLVLECHPAYAVVLSSDGRFIKVANLNYQPGDVITDIIPMQDRPARVSFFRRIKPALTAAACLCLFLLTGSFMIFTPAGHLQMKINPEVSMTINRLDYVIGLDGLNEDGEKLIDSISYRGKKTTELANELADHALDLQYLKSDGIIYIHAEDGSTNWRQKLENEIHNQMEQHLDPDLHIQVIIENEETDSSIETEEFSEESSISESTEEKEQETESKEKETESVVQTTKAAVTSAAVTTTAAGGTKPVQTKPAVTETKPVQTKPAVTETKPVQTKPDDDDSDDDDSWDDDSDDNDSWNDDDYDDDDSDDNDSDDDDSDDDD